MTVRALLRTLDQLPLRRIQAAFVPFFGRSIQIQLSSTNVSFLEATRIVSYEPFLYFEQKNGQWQVVGIGVIENPPSELIRVSLFEEPTTQPPVSRSDALVAFFRYGYASVLNPSDAWTLLLAPPSVTVYGLRDVSSGSKAVAEEIRLAVREAGAHVIKVQS